MNKIKTIATTSAVWVVIIGIGLLYMSNQTDIENTKYMNEKTQVASIQNAVSKYDSNNEVYILNFTRSSLDDNFDFIANYATNCTKELHVAGTYENDEIRIKSFKHKDKN
jgi:hypothetical protein